MLMASFTYVLNGSNYRLLASITRIILKRWKLAAVPEGQVAVREIRNTGGTGWTVDGQRWTAHGQLGDKSASTFCRLFHHTSAARLCRKQCTVYRVDHDAPRQVIDDRRLDTGTAHTRRHVSRKTSVEWRPVVVALCTCSYRVVQRWCNAHLTTVW